MDDGSSQVLYFSASQRDLEFPLSLSLSLGGFMSQSKTQSNDMAAQSCH